MGDKYIFGPSTLGAKLRNRRLEKGWLQKDVAEFMGVDECTIYLWENTLSEPRVIFYPKIIEFLQNFPFEIDRSTFGGMITFYRYSNGITPKEFGQIISADPSTVRDWENGQHLPHKQKLLNIEAIIYGKSNIKRIRT